MKSKPTDTLIHCGNHRLFTDDMQTEVKWIEDRAVASRHTRQWAKRFARKMLKKNTRVELFTVAEAQALADRERQQRLRAAYFYALESEVRRLAPDTDYSIPGCGCAAWCFAVDGNFAAGVPAVKAAAEFVRTHKGRPFTKRKAAVCS
jgi:hypothetical protein